LETKKRTAVTRDSFRCCMTRLATRTAVRSGRDEQTRHGNGGPYSSLPPLPRARLIPAQKPACQPVRPAFTGPQPGPTPIFPVLLNLGWPLPIPPAKSKTA
jgi:hypothetical protein